MIIFRTIKKNIFLDILKAKKVNKCIKNSKIYFILVLF